MSEGISINQFLVVASAEKMSALLTEDYLALEAEVSKRKDFERFMQKVPDIDPEAHDRL